MKLIIGLGNPGAEYQDTRHNIGFMVIDKLAKELGAQTVSFSNEKKFQAEVARIADVMLVKPQTYMNKSGEAVRKLIEYYDLKPSDIWVIHDDIDLPLGKIRIRQQGASGGHNGVDSLITALKTDQFVRFRLGIGRGKEGSVRNSDRNLSHRNVISFVLSRFREHEAGELKKLVKYGTESVRISLNDGLDKAMNRFN